MTRFIALLLLAAPAFAPSSNLEAAASGFVEGLEQTALDLDEDWLPEDAVLV